MTDTLERPDAETDVVDLRNSTFSIPSVQREPDAPRDHRAALQRRRRTLGFVLVAIVATLVLQQIIGVVMKDQRQRHLAHELTTPDKRITPGEASFLLQIPDIGVNDVVAEGASSSELRGGPGRVIGTAQLVDGGNVVVLGRKFRFGKPFARLGELRKGSVVVAQARGGGLTRAYTVESVKKVAADDVRPLRATNDRLTLITSGPGLLPTTRLVVVATPDAPAPKVNGRVANPVKIDIAALDERSTGAIGLVLAVVLLVGAALGAVVGVRRLNESYSRMTVLQAVIPIASLILIVTFIISDSVFPTTL